MWWKISALIVLVLGFFFVYRLYSLGKKSQRMSPAIGFEAGKLNPCGNKPNCVSSVNDKGDSHFIDAIELKESAVETFARIKQFMENELGSNLQSNNDQYMHFTYKSALFGFVDDIEFLWSAEENRVQVRSSSRVGHSDMGKNRERLEKLKKLL